MNQFSHCTTLLELELEWCEYRKLLDSAFAEIPDRFLPLFRNVTASYVSRDKQDYEEQKALLIAREGLTQ